MKRETRRMLVGFGWICSTVFLAGCENRITRENYDKLRIGMEYSQVVAILGEPEHCQAVMTIKSCVWGEEPKTITIQFVAEKIILYSNTGL